MLIYLHPINGIILNKRKKKKNKNSHIIERGISSLPFKDIVYISDLYKTTLLLNMSGLKAFQQNTGQLN